MNWWTLGCGLATIANFYLLTYIGKESKKKEELQNKNIWLEAEVGVCESLIKCQNSTIDALIKKIPDKRD